MWQCVLKCEGVNVLTYGPVDQLNLACKALKAIST